MTEEKVVDYSELLNFVEQGTRQEAYLISWIETQNFRETARKFNVSESTVRQSIKRTKKRAAEKGVARETFGNAQVQLPEGFVSHFATLQVNADGDVERMWPRIKKEVEDQTAYIIKGIETFYETYKNNLIKVEADFGNEELNNDVIPWVQIGDGHIGMLAHARETGQNFDIKIGERELCKGIDLLLDQVGKHERGVINDLGDFTHYENLKAVTEAGGNPLDYDTRFPKMIDSYLRIMHFIIDKALTKFKHVDIIVNQGNHSRTNDYWMARHLRLYYDAVAPGRVTVLNNDSVFIPYRMGNTFVMIHHSDKCKPKDLMHVMTTDFRKHYGETENHYIDIGHIHHNMVLKEHPGIVLESFNNLANNDKWHHEAGYRSRQSITCVFRSKEYGDVGRIVLPIRKIRDRLFRDNNIPLPLSMPVHTV